METGTLTDDDVRGLLLAVGASPAVAAGDLTRSFEELELDSLARIEIASRVKDRFGVEVEDDLTPSETPIGLQRLVNARLAAAGV
ncbi:acyl carrier protein [Plantactinospora endophytica]|uniref:Carrier domain-containing protein n=1 Tax=Plantactinospora endophytica TaxID=673535 RepID=A0ABQ4EBG5_9ACTN|nr:acyl carrier protein [Plantactinospora endophytica]GIG92078.1 hypothetical protein Pen02_70140 [Plantactinospora endophytica]